MEAHPAAGPSTKTVACTYFSLAAIASVKLALAGGRLKKSYPFVLQR